MLILIVSQTTSVSLIYYVRTIVQHDNRIFYLLNQINMYTVLYFIDFSWQYSHQQGVRLFVPTGRAQSRFKFLSHQSVLRTSLVTASKEQAD